jgi:hypothetical protein
MPELKYRTENQRTDEVSPATHPVTSGDPLRPQTEAQRVAEAEYAGVATSASPIGGLQRHPESGHLIGIEQQPYAVNPRRGDYYPRWITPHRSHVVFGHQVGARQEKGDFETENEIAGMDQSKPADDLKSDGDNLIVPRGAVVSVPNFQHHVRRHDGAIFVLVNSEADEDRAAAERQEEAAPVAYVTPVERQAAERIYAGEHGAKEASHREQRIAEIINEQRQRNIEAAERDLEAQRQREPVKPATGAEPPRSEPTHAIETPMGQPLTGVADTQGAALETDVPETGKPASTSGESK